MKVKFLLMIYCFLLMNGRMVAVNQKLDSPETDQLIKQANDFSFKGYREFGQHNFARAESLFFQSVETWKQILIFDEYRAFPHYSLGNMYMKTGFYSKSIEQYSLAEQILKNSRPERIYMLGSLFSAHAIFYMNLGDNIKADYYLSRSLNILEPICRRYPKAWAEAVFAQAELFYDQEKYQEAISIASEYLQSFAYDQYYFKNLIASCLLYSGQPGKAIDILKQVSADCGQDEPSFPETQLLLAKAYIFNDDLSLADTTLQIALNLFLKTKSPNDPWIVYTYELMGEQMTRQALKTTDSNLKIQKYYKSVALFDSALLINAFEPEKGIPYLDFEGDFITPTQVKDILVKRSEALLSLGEVYRSLADKETARVYLDRSLDTWLASIRYLHDFRISFLEDESKLTLSESHENVYDAAFSLAQTLFRETGLKKYLQHMLFISESAKSATFLSSLNILQARELGGIPDSLRYSEQQLINKLSGLKHSIAEEKFSTIPDSSKLFSMQNQLFEYQDRYDDLLYFFERNYPHFYNLKYRKVEITMEEICKNLDRNQFLVEYHINGPQPGEETCTLSALTFSSKDVSHHSREIPLSFFSSIDSLVYHLTHNEAGEISQDDFSAFTLTANQLYQWLIEPLSIPRHINEIIIIPDGLLAYLPFDVLLKKPVNDPFIHYYDLPYLVNNYSFVYSYSSTLHFQHFGNKKKEKKGILAFAPEYSFADKDLTRQKLSYLTPNYPVIKPLPGALEEVNHLATTQKCTIFTGEEATETVFKEIAGDYDILHLAMHAILNDSLPMYSKLVFSIQHDSVDDGFLTVQEMYNIKLNARMAVLSACNTGTGKLRGGEGVMSMARGFLYAGCPSILMTLWGVEDMSSADLMIWFYENLRKGYSKPEALRRAKLNHLKNKDPFLSHPYFWAGYIVVGNPSPLEKSWKNEYTLYLLIPGIALLVIILKKRKAKKRNEVI